MHAISGGWSGHAVAVSASHDSGGRKSRIRRSKEERKDMVESFIKKYQVSNNGNFPSLNLTHKEVGGSFYTVREIVREIIQENRVLAPPKVLLEDDGHSGFLEKHSLGSVSVEPITINLSGSDQIHMETHSVANEHSEVDISNSSVEVHEPSPLKLKSEQINGLNKMVERDEISDGIGRSHYASGDFSNHEFENGRIISDVEVPEGNPQNDKPTVTDLSEEQPNNGPGEIIDKTGEESFVDDLDREKNGARNVKMPQAAASHMNFDVVVEKFPLRPFPRTFQDEDGGQMPVETVKDKPMQYDPTTFVQDPSIFLKKKDANALLDSKGSTASESSGPGVDGSILELKTTSLPDGTRVKKSIEHSISKNSTTIGRKFNDKDTISGNNLTTGKINFKTPSKSNRPETNPLVALLKGIISSFKKFWTE